MKEMLNTVSAQSPLKMMLIAACSIVILAGMKAAASIVTLVLLGLLITLLVYPFMEWMTRRGYSSRMAYFAALGLVLLGALIIVFVGVASLTQAAVDLPAYAQKAEARFTAMGSSASSTLSQASGTVLSLVATVAASIVGLVVFCVFLLILIAFMLAEADTFAVLVKRTVGPDNPRLQRVAESTTSVVTYMSITARINFVIALGDMLLLWLIGVPDVLLWGLVSFLFGFIPYIGYWISFIPPMIIAYGIGGVWAAAAVALGYFVINGLINQLVAPRLYGKGLNLSVTLTLVAVFFWGWLLGSIGGMLAVPLTAVIRAALLANYSDTEWLATILSDNRSLQATVDAQEALAVEEARAGEDVRAGEAARLAAATGAEPARAEPTSGREGAA